MVTKVCVKNDKKERGLPPKLLTTSLEDFFRHSSYDLVIELISDDLVALEIVRKCNSMSLPLISANKKMIAQNLPEISDLDIPFLYEGAVAGSIPIIQSLKTYYQQQEITSLQAIINGSSNYILTEMVRSKLSFEDALEKAQELGFAEADPTLDISGQDAANKLAILAHQIFGETVNLSDINLQSLEDLDREDLLEAHFYGNKVKQIARITKEEEGLRLKVSLEEIAADHPLYFVDDEYNAINLHIGAIGDQLLYGKGAGSLPTGAPVLHDLQLMMNELKVVNATTHRLSA